MAEQTSDPDADRPPARLPAAPPPAAFVGRRAEALCPGAARFVAAAQARLGPPQSSDISAQRAAYSAFSARFARPRPPGVGVEDAVVATGTGAVPVRFYRPPPGSSPRPADGRHPPCVLFLHGGGWVLGDLDSHDGITAEIAARTGAVVVAVDYRRAPEHPFPAGLMDSRAVLETLARDGDRLGVDHARIVVAGDSAGGNFAAALCLAARDSGRPAIRGQALIYPVLGTDVTLPSYVENATAPMLTSAEMRRYWSLYLYGLDGTPPRAEAQAGDALTAGETVETRNPLAAPLLARTVAGLPPTLILTAGHDPVRDDGVVYAGRLASAGVTVVHHDAADLPHGYLRARGMSPSADAEMDRLCGWLVGALWGGDDET